MAMTPIRVGQANQSGDVRANFAKISTAEVIAAFERTAQFKDKQMMRTISSGKSAAFPVTGRIGAEYHTIGTQLTGLAMPTNERVITIDDKLVSHATVSDVDEAMNHFDVRSQITTKMGEELAQAFDQNTARVGLQAAKAAAVVNGLPGGSTIVDADFRTSSADLASGHFNAAQVLDEKWVPAGERYSFLKPQQYYMLAQDTNVINKDWDGRGSYAEGSVKMIADIMLIKTNNLPTTNVTGTYQNKYNVDASATACLIMTPQAVGTVKLKDLQTEMDYLIDYQVDMLVAKYLLGHGILRPECAVELATA